MSDQVTPSKPSAPSTRGLRKQPLGYPIDRTHEVLTRLDAQIAANEALLREGEQVPERESDEGADGEDAEPEPTPEPAPEPLRPRRRSERRRSERHRGERPRWGRRDTLACAAYVLMALYVLFGLIGNVSTGHLSQGVQDHQAFEWYFGASAHNLTSLSNPLFTDRQNFPDGVNLMANAAMIGIGLPLAPLTLLTSAHVTFFVVELVGLAGTAAGWYWFFRRRGLVRVGALVGGWFCGFAPAMVAHANGHPNFIAQFLIPIIIDRLICLADPGRRQRRVRDAIILGLLVAWQIFIGEEVLLLTAIGLLIAGVVLLAHRRINLRALLPGVAIGAALTTAIVALPLWWQFFGPRSYASIWHPPAGNDLAALWGRATRSLGADPWASAALSMNRTEENAFFGIPLLVFVAIIVVVLIYRPVVQALAAVVVVALWLSLGEQVMLRGEPSGIPSLWSVFDTVPVLENVLPTRFSMIAIPAIAALLAVAIDAAFRAVPSAHSRRMPRAAGGAILTAAAAVALAPTFPTPLQVGPRPKVPRFFTGDAWRDYSHGGSILAVPPTDIVDARAFDWQLAADTMAFPLVEGYFVGPNGQPDRMGQYGAVRRPLSLWLYNVNAANSPTAEGKPSRRVIAEDLRAWRTDAVVLPMRDQSPALKAALDGVLGHGRQVDDVYVWDVRSFRS